MTNLGGESWACANVVECGETNVQEGRASGFTRAAMRKHEIVCNLESREVRLEYATVPKIYLRWRVARANVKKRQRQNL